MGKRSHYIYGLGHLFLGVAAGHALLQMARGGPVLEAVLDLVLIGVAGVLILFVARWLTGTEFDPALYPRIALWCLGGVGMMLVFIVLRAIHPGVTVEWTFGTRAIALSLGSIAGIAIGIHEAQALTREQELNRGNDELRRTKRTLKQRNEELVRTQAELEQTVRDVEQSNERLEQFAYAASHDLQEPLRMISSYLELLEDRHADDLDDDASEFVDFAIDGADRMQTMVENLLQYSHVESHGEPTGAVDLGAVIDDARTDLQVRIEETDTEITVDELPAVDGDATQLRQLFQNLLSNSIEYAGDGQPHIHVSAEERGADRVISVSDEGIGIDPDEQERIFEIFQRLHTTDEHAGSGIGLALCERIVERHGGEIWAESRPGDGSTFSFTIPAAEERPATPDATSHD